MEGRHWLVIHEADGDDYPEWEIIHDTCLLKHEGYWQDVEKLIPGQPEDAFWVAVEPTGERIWVEYYHYDCSVEHLINDMGIEVFGSPAHGEDWPGGLPRGPGRYEVEPWFETIRYFEGTEYDAGMRLIEDPTVEPIEGEVCYDSCQTPVQCENVCLKETRP